MFISFRLATSKDIPAMMELLDTLFNLETDFEFEADHARRGLILMLQEPASRRIVVAQCGDDVIGMGSGQLIASTAMGTLSLWVEDVILQAPFRGRGLMPQLLAELEKWALEQGATRVQVHCDLNNAPALNFYPKVGFEMTQLGCFQKKI